MIIVEGPDNSGKSSLVKMILEHHPELLPLKSQGPDSDYDFWMGTLTRLPNTIGRLICDRFFYSEIVYGSLVRSGIRLTLHQQEVIHSMLVTMEPLIIRCHLIENEGTFSERPQIFDWKTTQEADRLYEKILGPGSALQYWFEVPSQVAHVLARVDLFLEIRDEWEELRTQVSYGRGQMRSPRLMIVGEKFSTNNRWQIPFERSRSGILLHNALRLMEFTMDEIWFTNATKISAPLNPINVAKMKREIELIGPQNVIALGNRASGLLTAIGVDHIKVRHPGWFLRQYSNQKANREFVIEFKYQMGSILKGGQTP